MNERKDIWLGLLGLGFPLMAWLLVVMLTGVFVYAELASPGGMDEVADDSPIAIGAGLILIVSALLAFVGAVLAIVSFFRPNQNRVFPIITVVLSGAFYFLLGALFVIGVYFPHVE
jgi:hypothetical protein